MRSGYSVSRNSIGIWWFFNEFADFQLVDMLFGFMIYSQTTGRMKSSSKEVSLLDRQPVWRIFALLGFKLVLYRPTAQPHSTQLQAARTTSTRQMLQAKLQHPSTLTILNDQQAATLPTGNHANGSRIEFPFTRPEPQATSTLVHLLPADGNAFIGLRKWY